MAPSSKRSRFGKSISKVRENEDILMKKHDFLKKKMKAEANTARSNASSNKRVTLQTLKRKRQQHEKQQQHNATDFAHASNSDTEDVDQIFLSAMGTAVKAMKAAHNDMDVDKVHDLMEEIVEQNELAKKIAEAVSNSIGFGSDIIDKADLEAELAALKDEINNEKLISTSTDTLGTQLPEAPKDNIPVHQNKKKEDDEMAELESWATS